MRTTFRFRAIPFVATVLVVALGVALGQWQERRADQKIALQAKLAAHAGATPLVITAQPLQIADVAYRKVAVAGEFVPDWPLFLDNRPQDGKVGFYLMMPFKIAGSNMHVLVARGWVPRYTGEHDRLPEFGTPSGTVIVTGIAKASMGKVMQLGDPATLKPQAILQNLTTDQFAAASKVPVQPFFIEQTAPAAPGDNLARNWPAPALGVEKHQGYAFQWYALAVMALLFFVFTGIRRGTK
jgi:surfeit locus 1 family protein